LAQIECEDLVGQLARRSLLAREGDDLRLHQLVRDFCRDALGEQLPAVQEAVVATALAYVARYREETPEHHDRLEAELGNLLGAVDHAAKNQAWVEALALADPLVYAGVLRVRGYWAQLVSVGRRGIEAARQLADESALARLTHNTAGTLRERGELEEARRLYGESLEAFRKLGDQGGIARSLHNLGAIAQAQGDYAEARQLYGESLEIFTRLGSPYAQLARKHLAEVEKELKKPGIWQRLRSAFKRRRT